MEGADLNSRGRELPSWGTAKKNTPPLVSINLALAREGPHNSAPSEVIRRWDRKG